MTLIEQIKAKNLEARKAKLTAVVNVLTPLIGEAEMVGKNAGHAVTDAEVVQMIKKFIKNLDETIRILGDADPRTLAAMGEKHTLETFLPAQLNEPAVMQELAKIKFEINAGPKDMGKMLQILKSRFDGQYDGKMASTLAKALLS
jgi:uncharacterized protein YqeY